MKPLSQKFLEHRVVTSLFGVALVFVLGGFLWAVIALMPIAHSIPLILRFNDVDGITNVGGMGQIIFMGFFGVLVVGMNYAIALEFDVRRPFFGKFLAGMTLAFAVLLFLAFAAIISVNI
jgi:hypothetical protein